MDADPFDRLAATAAREPGEAEAVDPLHLRQALGRFATGVTVVTTRTPDRRLLGLTVNSFAAVSLEPPLVLWSLQRSAASLESFLGTGWFAVNVLAAHQCDLSRRFAAQRPDRFAAIEHAPGLGGCPILKDSLAHFECRREKTVEGGDHVIFIGRVLRASYRDGKPLIFSLGRYCSAEALAETAGDSE